MADVYAVLDEFHFYYHRERIHMGRACKGKTPEEAFPDLPNLPQLPNEVNPNQWLQIEHGRVFRRRIRSNGTIQVDKHTYYVSSHLAKRSVLVHLDAPSGCLYVTLQGSLVCEPLPLKGLYPDKLSLQEYLKRLSKEAISIAYYRRMMWMQSGQAA